MKSRLGKIKLTRESMISVLIILPYLVSGQMSNSLRIWLSKNAYLPASIVLMVAVWVFFLVLNLSGYKNRRIKCHFYTTIFSVLMLYTAIGIFQSRDPAVSLSVWIWLCFPMILASTIIRYCRIRQLNYGKIIEGMIYWFVLYSIILLLYNIFRYGLFSNESYRMNSRAGGAVIYGYTVAVVFSLCICYKKHFTLLIYYFILAVFTLSAFGTGSRGAVWPILLLWVLNFLFEKMTPRRLGAGFIVAILCVLGSLVNLESLLNSFASSRLTLLSRLFNTENEIRMIVLQNEVDLFMSQKPIYSLFGRGLGNFFPYQDWLIRLHSVVLNTYSFEGRKFLVQPHNSFIYILIETGLIGFIIWCSFFAKEIKIFIKQRFDRSVFYAIFVLIIVFVNLFDSIFFVQPAVAMVYWLLLLLVYEDYNSKIAVGKIE